MKPTPEPILVITGDQHTVQRTIDDFLVETKVHVQERDGLPDHAFEIRSGEITYSGRTSDDSVTYLRTPDRILAGVFETRTEFNNVLYTFFRRV